MTFPSDRTISIQQLVDAVKRHKLIGLLTFSVIMAVIVAAWIFLPREYGSEGRMVVRMGRANVGMNTTPDGASMVSIQDTRETEIRSVIDLVESYDVLGKVVDNVGADKILANTIDLPIPGLGGGSPTDEMTAEEFDAIRRRERAIKQLSKELTVATEKKSANISIYCTGASPQLAQEIVNEVMETAQESHVDVHSVDRSRTHFDRELAEKEAELKVAQQAMEQFATENQFLSVGEARQTLNGVIDKLENDLVDTEVNLRQSLAMVVELKKQSDGVEIEFEMPRTGMEKQATAGAQQQMYDRIGEKARLMARYSKDHPKITEINAEIARLREEVGELPEERMELARVRNPVYEQLMIALAREAATAESLEGRLEQIEANLAEKRKRLATLNTLKTEDSRLERQIALAQNAFDTYAKKRNEARMADQLDKEDISDIVIQQSATLMLKKVNPKGSVMLPLGLFFAATCGLLAAIFADRKNLIQLSTPEEIEEVLDIPVLVTIPRVHSSRVLTN